MTMPAAFWGDKITMNTTVSGSQAEASVAALANGQFVATWRSGSEIAARVYHANGTPATGEFPVNASILGDQAEPVVCGLTDGRFVVAWADEETHSIVGRIFNLNGTQAGGEFTVATWPNGLEQPSIAALTEGGFVVAWEQHYDGGNDYDINARVYDAAGVPGNIIVVDNNTVAERAPAVAGLSDGNFVVVWEDAGSAQETDNSGSHIRGRVYSSSGVGQGDEFIVNFGVVGSQSEPAVAALSDGRFVVSWTHGASGIIAREFSNDGTPLAPDFIVTADGEDSSVTGLADGRYLFAFERWDPAGQSIYGVIGADSRDLDQDPGFFINAASGFQFAPALTTLVDGRVVTVWTHQTSVPNNPSNDAVEAQIIDLREGGANVQGHADLPDEFIGTMGSDVLKGAGGHDLLDGGDADDDSRSGEDWLFGGPGDDTLLGGRGHSNNLVGGPGGDTLIGRVDAPDYAFQFRLSPMDVAEYTGSPEGVVVNLETGDAAGGDANGDQLIGIDGLVGSAHPDGLIGNDGVNVLLGAAGGDTLKGGGGCDALMGEAGNDSLVGGAGIDMAIFDGDSTDYAITRNGNGSLTVSDQRAGTPDGADTVIGVEYLMFADRALPTVAELGDVVWQDSVGIIATAGRLVFPLETEAVVSATADFDGDGDGDIMIHSPEGGVAIALLENGEFDFDDIVPFEPVPTGWHVRGAADFDGDGDADILWRHDDGLSTIWEIEDGGYVVNHNLPDVPANWDVEGTGDFDGDGDADLLWRHYEGQVVIWEMQDGDFVVNNNLDDVDTHWQIRGTGDFDADGDTDIVWQHAEGQVLTWEMQDGDHLDHHEIEVGSAGWQIQGTRDFDSDGDDDLLWRHEDGTVLTWEIQGNAFVQNHNYGMVSNEWRIRGTGEFDLM